MDSQQFHRISKALAEPRRYELLSRIAKCRELACSDVRGELPITAATLSHHLKELTQRKGFRILLFYNLPSWDRYFRQTLRRNFMWANWPSLRISTKPALTSSLRWCDSVAAVIGSSPRTSLHASSRHLAIRDKSS